MSLIFGCNLNALYFFFLFRNENQNLIPYPCKHREVLISNLWIDLRTLLLLKKKALEHAIPRTAYVSYKFFLHIEFVGFLVIPVADPETFERGGQETWNISRRARQPFFGLFFTGQGGGHGPLAPLPPGSATEYSCSINVCPVKHKKRRPKKFKMAKSGL